MKFDSIINPTELHQILGQENLVIIDVRFNLKDTEWGRTEFEKSHIPGAQYAHLDDDLSAEIIPEKTGRHPWPSIGKIESIFSKLGIGENSQIIIYDQFHGGVAARLWAMCLYVGLENTAVLNGGWKAWEDNTYPVSSESAVAKRSEFAAKESIINIVDVDELQNHECLIDARASKRYHGLEEPIDPVAGHIPGAISIPFLDNLNADHSWKSKEEIESRFTDVPTGKSVIYCGSGVTACHNLLALKYIGYPLASIYGGSWSHYITDANREIASDSV